jgi:hypothetical protein
MRGEANKWMNECGVGHNIQALAHCNLQWPIVLPLLIKPFINPTLRMKCRTLFMGHHSSHLVSQRTGPGDKIWNKLWPHNHIGYMWLIHLLLGTFHKWGHLSIPVWKGVLLGESVLYSHTIHLNWSLFNFNRVFVLLAEGPGISTILEHTQTDFYPYSEKPSFTKQQEKLYFCVF